LPEWKAFDERTQQALVIDGSPSSRTLPTLEGVQALAIQQQALRVAGCGEQSR
jgi:hypothetical protein